MSAKDYRPLVTGRYFFWDRKLNRIIYTDEEYKVLFPDECKTATKENGWTSLSGEINEDKNYNVEGTSVTIASAEQYYAFVKANKTLPADTKIKFTASKIDLMGADIGFEIQQSGTYSISGAEGGTEIVGLAQLKNASIGSSGEYANKKYNSGLIQKVGEYPSQNASIQLTVSNITVSNAVVGDLETSGVGIIVGRVNPGATVTLQNITVKDSTVNGSSKVGSLVGHNQGGTVEVTGCMIENVSVNCSEGESGKVIGTVSGKSTTTIDKAFENWVNNVSLNLVKGAHDRKTVELAGDTKISLTKNEKNLELNVASATIVEKVSTSGEHQGHKLFYKDAYLTVLIDNNGYNRDEYMKIITVGTTSKVNDVNLYKFDAYNASATINGTTYDNFTGAININN